MNFFCMENELDNWVNKMNISKELYFKLDILEALDAAKMIFRVDK